ncbi:C39 family peptidase [Amphritea sp. 1_MG-2023]|uniref:C39 family peptidase n=1 Tax=Amphritea sp. 1_MG-2023 TaxID=3062670 RepID=UPI0026E20928|nr:C39 family peptidase [Amphritea sp. 1_MG-2023]MDO6565017.1 C39 family peptidase [Amphritea sp. 1_MG-2023]
MAIQLLFVKITYSIKLALTLVLVFCANSSLLAAQIELANVLPGSFGLSKPVVSMREQRYQNLVRQQTDFSCGAAALATVLRYGYGLRVTEEDMLDGLFAVSDINKVREQGFSLLNIKHYLERVGMRGRGYKVEPDTLLTIKIPTIVLLDLKGYKHFVVLKKTEQDLVYLADPALGNKIMPKEDFLTSWNGIVFAVIGRGFDKTSVLMSPRPQLTARTLSNTFAPLSDAQLLEFGFRHSELF